MSVRILLGDCLARLAELPDASVNTCVTSPPYFGLRDYGVDGQIGLENTPDAFIAKMVEVFREVRRVLRDDGTLWLNLGDSYAGSWGAQSRGEGVGEASSLSGGQVYAAPKGTHAGSVKRTPGLKPKDLMGIPWRVAFALQADGWYLRQDIIWAKPNPMPESVRDRCTKAHEYVFLLSKAGRPTIWKARDTLEWSGSPDLSERVAAPTEDDPNRTRARWMAFDYYFDADAIAEGLAPASVQRLAQDVESQRGSDRVPGKTNGAMKAVGGKGNRRTFRGGGAYSQGQSFDNSSDAKNDSVGNAPNETGKRNKRSVWTVATQPFKEAHFATYPPSLIEPCILAGSPRGGVVLDPFGGAGTTGLVADRLGRNAVLIELNPEYAEIARRRLASDAGMFADVEVAA